jgi:hypothetical protein
VQRLEARVDGAAEVGEEALRSRGVVQELRGRELLGAWVQPPTWPSTADMRSITSAGPTAQPTRRPVAAKALLIASM